MNITIKTAHPIHHLTRFAAIFLAACTLAAADPPAKQAASYKLQTKFISSEEFLLPPTIISEEGLFGSFKGHIINPSFIDDETMRILLRDWNQQKGVDLTGAPSIVTPAGQKAVIYIQSDVQYFEPTEDGAYELKSLKEEDAAGVYLATTLNPTKEKNEMTMEIHFRINTLLDRMKIPGVSLDVGKPVMQTQEIRTSLTASMGQWVLLQQQQLEDIATGKSKYLMVLMKVSPVEKTEQEGE